MVRLVRLKILIRLVRPVRLARLVRLERLVRLVRVVRLIRLGLTGCDHRHQSLLGRCGEEDKEGDELGSDADEEAEGGRTPEMCRARSSAEGAQRETHLRSSSTGGFRVRM